MATGYGLDGPGIESRWGAKFSARVQTGPGAHPASYTMSTGSFLGVKSGRVVTLTPHPFLVPWSWVGRAIPLLLYRASVPVQGCTLPYLGYNLKSCLPFSMNMSVYEWNYHLLSRNSGGLNSLCCIRSVLLILLPLRLGFFCIDCFFSVRAVV